MFHEAEDNTSSGAMQEYLAEAYRIAHYQDNDPYVSTSALAASMGVTAAAVTRMVKRLKAEGYVEHVPYHGLALTPAGERTALLNIRKHRLVERFLTDVMGFGWHEVHDAADALGDNASDIVVARMEQMAGYPRRCPHGEPIPSADGVMPNPNDQPLSGAAVGRWVLSRVHTHDASLLQYLHALGLHPGAALELVERSPYNGPLKLKVNGAEHYIGHELAAELRVCAEGAFDLA